MKKWLCLLAVLLFLYAGGGAVQASAISEIGGGIREIPRLSKVEAQGDESPNRPNGHRIGRNAPDLTRVNMSAADNNDKNPLYLLLLGLGVAAVMLVIGLFGRRRSRIR
jgi:hypothetical protein